MIKLNFKFWKMKNPKITENPIVVDKYSEEDLRNAFNAGKKKKMKTSVPAFDSFEKWFGNYEK